MRRRKEKDYYFSQNNCQFVYKKNLHTTFVISEQSQYLCTPLLNVVIVVQLVRTPDCGSGGRGFESRLSPKKLLFWEAFLLLATPN